MLPRRVLLHTHPKCILCAQVQERLADAGIAFVVVEATTPDQVAELTRQYAPNFPMLIVDDVYVGGFTHVVHLLMTGRMKKLLGDEEAPAPRRGPLTEAAALQRVCARLPRRHNP
jgi:glutaredoxin-related protein